MKEYFCIRIGLGLVVLLMTGCQMVSVKQQNLGTSLSTERDSILTHGKLSEASLNLLSMTGQDSAKCISTPDVCIREIRNIPEIADEQLLSTSSEIFLAHANQLDSEANCDDKYLNKKNPAKRQQFALQYQSCVQDQLEALSQSIRFSYAYLFATQRPPEQRLFDNRQVQVRDFYNQAIANLIKLYNEQDHEHTGVDFSKPLPIGKSFYHFDTSTYPTLDIKKINKLVSTYNLKFSGLSSISRRDGFGSEFVIEMKNDGQKQYNKYLADPLDPKASVKEHQNIHQALYAPATMVIEPQNKRDIESILTDPNLEFRVIDPNLHPSINIAGHQYPVAANFSAPYGLWLANNNLGSAGYRTLVNREQNLIMPHLFMLEPYNPKKKIIVMVHGLASSPEAWIAMTNDIMGDSILRDNFQVWQVFYSTNMPIIESRFQIYALLKQAFDELQQHYPNQPANHAVLVGHSMGGIISRLLVSDEDFTPQVLEYLRSKQLSQYAKVKDLPHAQQRLVMDPLAPPFDRAVFISSPFRGTEFADRWFTLAARRLIKLPQSFLTATYHTISFAVTADDVDAKLLTKRFGRDLLQNGPSDLSKKSAFIQITEDSTISPNVKYHLIIGNNTKSNDPNNMSDGIVPYQSAHLEGAESEKIIHGGHSIQYTPEAVLELRRILRLHLSELGIN